MKNIIITGGAGFIGSHVVRLFVNKYSEYNIINLDKLTYAGNLANLKDIEDKPNYKFVKMDICDFDAFYQLMQDEQIDGIIHLAAESHVDRSIKDPFTFARTNVMGTLSLLQAAKLYWESLPEKYEGKRFYHISTDEVYGALSMNHSEGIESPFTTTASSSKHHLVYGDDFFYETTKYNPHSPYSASKASSDHFVRAFHDTYGMPTIVTNCSNNYGPYQFPEKLIPLFINNIRHRKPLPVYGKGENEVRALDGVSFSVEKGEFVAVIGPSGSGKSTLLHILGGVDRPTGGKVFMDGKDVYAQNEEQLAIFRRRQVGLIYQFYNLIPVLNVTENITLPVLMDGQKVNQNRLAELMTTLKLTGRENHLPNQLSGGQQQRVSIGRALMNAPAVVLADEPTGNLDSKSSREIVELLKVSNEKYGQTLIVITHDESIALQADRILSIEDGKITRDEVIRR